VSEHREEPCFLNIFNGSFIILRGKRGQTSAKNNWQLFYVRGVVPNEATLVEVEPRVHSLRSRTAFAFINPSSHTIYVWFGCKCLDETRKVMHNAIDRLITHKPPQIGLKVDANYVTKELDEGKEDKEFWDLFESQDRRQQRQRLYHSLIDSRFTYDFTPRLFHLTSSSGEFTAKEILCSYRSVHNVTPYPFTQEDIYSAQQPTFFLFDNCHQIFLWESKYAFSKEATDDLEANATTGSQTIRWSAERKCALDSAIAYCFGILFHF
jgi:supervillin